MKCTLDGHNARVVAKAVQSLSKFGAELFVEADSSGLQLRALNATLSAVGTFRFSRPFFQTFHLKAGEENYCKIAMKACLKVFKSMKQVESCEMRLLAEESKFQVQLKCRLDTVKNSIISILDGDNISAALSPSDTQNQIVGSPKIFNEISSNFNVAEQEITLEALRDGLTVKNYVEGSRVNDKFMRSQLKLNSAEFETYDVHQEGAVTFCLKEFRAFLLFAEAINENLFLHFNEAGSPIFLTIKKLDLIECTLIMSTLSPDDVSFYDDCRENEVNNVSRQDVVPSRKRKQNESKTSATPSTKKRLAEESTLSNDSTLVQFNSDRTPTTLQSLETPRDLTQQELEMNDDHDDLLLAAAAVTAADSVPPHPPVPQSEVFVTFYDTEESNKRSIPNPQDDECIPQSPGHKKSAKIRSIFSRCFEATYVPKEPSPNSQIYVPNSDTED